LAGHYCARLLCLFFLFHNTLLSAAPLLWKVLPSEDSGKAVPVYLFGSIHYGRDNFYPLPAFVERAFITSETLAVELNVLDLDASAARRALVKHGRYAEGHTLKSVLPSSDWALLEGVCDKLALEVSMFQNFKPWLVATQLLGEQIDQSGFSQSLGLDQHFLARAEGHKIIELETVEQQLSLLGSMSQGDQLHFLRQSLLDVEMNPEFLEGLALAWRAGTELELEEMILGAFQQSETGRRLYQSIFVDRNINMALAVEQFMRKKQAVFMVVGLGHLIGEDGVVALLKARNYRLERVMLNDHKLEVESPL
jgi:uncharacterized protein YbaP (TraB family)